MTGRYGWLFKRVPALDSLRDYSWQALSGDLTAGFTVATVAVPQAMAYATLAGVPAEYGLYTAIVMTGVGALFDSSRLLINGPTNAISIALFSALAVVPEGERVPAAMLLALLVGLVQLGIALLKLGDLSRYVSPSVLVGFTTGAGTLLVLSQLQTLLGLKTHGGPEDHVLMRFYLTLTGSTMHAPTVVIGVGTIALVVAVRGLNGVLRRRGARFPIPQHLVAIVLMAALVWAFDLHTRFDVAIVGHIPAALPSFDPPHVSWEHTRLLSGSAFAIALLGLLEAIAMAKAIAAHTGQRLDINQQCISEGMANLTGSFFQCFPGSGSLTRSAVNQQAGAVSQWSGVFAAVAVAATVLLFAPLAQYIPRSSLAGLLMLAAFRMVDREQLAFHLRATRFDAGVVIATAVAAVAISVEFCILIGVFLSFVLYMPRAAQVRMTQLVRTPNHHLRPRRPGEAVDDGLLIYQLEGELFFGTEPDLEAHCAAIAAAAAHGKTRAVILVLERARNPDAAFLQLLRTLDRRLRERGVRLILCGVADGSSQTFACTGIPMQTGEAHVFCDADGGDDTPSACHLLEGTACADCPRRHLPHVPPPPLNYTI